MDQHTSILAGCHESFPDHEIDRRLIGSRESQRPSVGAGGIRENAGHLSLRDLLMHVVWPLCRCAEHIRN
jgi:hypothetical protein